MVPGGAAGGVMRGSFLCTSFVAAQAGARMVSWPRLRVERVLMRFRLLHPSPVRSCGFQSWRARLCLFGIAGAALVMPARAQVIDQQNAAGHFAWRRCDGTGRSLFQSFLPRFTPLLGVELEVRDVPVGGERAHVRVRAGWTRGPVIGEAIAMIASEGWARFEFAAPAEVDPGRDYFIEWVEPQSWWVLDGTDPYPRGEAYNCGETLLVLDDYNFRTLAPAAHVETRPWAEVKAILSGGSGR